MEPNDLKDASLIKGLVDALRTWRSEGGSVKSAKPLRELIWFYWEEPRIPHPRVRNKYPFISLWTPDAIRAFEFDPRCRLVIDHAVPVQIVIFDLLDGPERSAMEIADLLSRGMGEYVVMTPEEDGQLTAAGYRSRMPEGWNFDDPLARYRSAGFDVSTFLPLASVRSMETLGG